MSRLSFIVLYHETRINLYRIIFYSIVILKSEEIWLMISPSGFPVVNVPSQNLDFYHLLLSFWGLPEERFVWLYLVNYLNCYFQSNCEHSFWPAKLVEKVGGCLLFNANKQCFSYIMARTRGSLRTRPTHLVGFFFIVLAHWNNSPRIDMSPHSDTLSWFRAN